MTIKSQLGVQSWCFREFHGADKLVDLTRQCGLASIELCGVHAEFGNPATHEETISAFQAKDIAISSVIAISGIGVECFSGNKADEEKLFQFARKAGAMTISANFDIETVPGAYRVAEELSERYGVRVAIHNHGGSHWLGSATALQHVFSHTSDRIGLCLDTAWALDAREDPVAVAEKFQDRLYSVHIKDFVFDRSGKPEDVVAGTGNLDLPRLLRVLDSMDFAGPLVIEYEGDAADPVPALSKSVQAVQKNMP